MLCQKCCQTIATISVYNGRVGTFKCVQKNQGKLTSREFKLISINECVQMHCIVFILSGVLKATQFLINTLAALEGLR